MNPHKRTRLQGATTMDNLTNYDQEQSEDDDIELNMTQLLNTITNVATMIQRNTQKHKLLQIQVFTFEGQRERYNEFKHLLLNHLRPFQNKITEEEKLHFSTSLLREAAIEFWQTIRLTPDNTLREVFQMIRKEYARNDFKEVRRYQWDHFKYEPQHESFSDFLENHKKTAKQAFDSKTNDYVNAFLFGKLPAAIQNDLSVAGKQDAKWMKLEIFSPSRNRYDTDTSSRIENKVFTLLVQYSTKSQSNKSQSCEKFRR